MFHWRSRVEKTLEKKATPAFQALFFEMSEILKPYGYTIDKKSGDERILAKDHPFYEYRYINVRAGRTVALTASLNGSVSIDVKSSHESFSVDDFLKLHFGIKESPGTGFLLSDAQRYYAEKLAMFGRCLGVQEFREVIEGKIWKAWVCDMDWGDYK